MTAGDRAPAARRAGAVRPRSRPTLLAAGAGVVLGSMVAMGAGSGPAAAETRMSPGVGLTCTSVDVAGPATATLPPLAATDSKDPVPEDDLVEVALDAALPDPGPATGITGAGMTIPIPTDVANVDLRFAGGTLPALRWDATSGTEIVVTFRSVTPMAPADVRLPTVIVSYALDEGSAGRTVEWPTFNLVVVSVVRDGVPGLISCRPGGATVPVNSTRIGPPVGLTRRTAPPSGGQVVTDPGGPPGPGAAAGPGVTDSSDPVADAISAARAAGAVGRGEAGAPVPAEPVPVSGAGGDAPSDLAMAAEPALVGAGSVNPWLVAGIGVAGAALLALFARRPSS